MKPGIITLGEALVEIMRPDKSQPLDKPGQFDGPFPSGAPAIFAVAAARFGLDTGFICCTGQDAFGRLLQRKFRAENVDISQAQVIPGRSTGVAFVAYTATGDREFVFHIRDSAAGAIRADLVEPAYFAAARWLHISGSSLMLHNAWLQVILEAAGRAADSGGRISFDPNLRPDLMPDDSAAEIMAPLLRFADIIFPTEAELHRLVPEAHNMQTAAASICKPGAAVIVKRGSHGCSVLEAGTRLDIPGHPVAEIDPTGAGDVFAAACLAGIENGSDIEEAARLANAAGALAVTRRGPMEGIPTLDAAMQLSKNAEEI